MYNVLYLASITFFVANSIWDVNTCDLIVSTMGQLIGFCLKSSPDVKKICLTSMTCAWGTRLSSKRSVYQRLEAYDFLRHYYILQLFIKAAEGQVKYLFWGLQITALAPSWWAIIHSIYNNNILHSDSVSASKILLTYLVHLDYGSMAHI